MTNYIGAVIGPGGKVIQDIQARTGTTISIEEIGDKGHVSITCSNGDGMQQAIDVGSKELLSLRLLVMFMKPS